MNLISIRKKRRPAIALLLCTGLLGACPPDAVADAGDRLPVPEIQQSKSPVKRTLVGTVTDASTGETLIGVNVIIKGTTQGTITDVMVILIWQMYQVLQRLCRFRILVCRHKKW